MEHQDGKSKRHKMSISRQPSLSDEYSDDFVSGKDGRSLRNNSYFASPQGSKIENKDEVKLDNRITVELIN